MRWQWLKKTVNNSKVGPILLGRGFSVKYRNMVIAIAAVFLTACGTLSNVKGPVEVVDSSEPVVEAAKPEVDVAKPEIADAEVVPNPVPETEIKTIGQVEYVDIMPEGIRQKGRIDTGAETTSLGVSDIQFFERDSRNWVKFNVNHRITGEVTEFSKPVERMVLIKRHGAENVERPVVKMTLAIGSIEHILEVSLTDRSKFEFPVLIGRNFLDGNVAVNVSHKFLMLDK